jgi:hypothetical protein
LGFSFRCKVVSAILKYSQCS